MSDTNIRVLIVDDSALMRNLVGKIFEGADDMDVVAKAMNGRIALDKVSKAEPDVIVLDLEMPEMNGIEFLKERKKRNIDIPVVILSSLAKKGARITMEALDLGASDFILKPSGSVSTDIHQVGEKLLDTVRVYGKNYKQKRRPEIVTEEEQEEPKAIKKDFQPSEKVDLPNVLAKKTVPKKRAVSAELEIVAIGISTGGPNALRKMFMNLDKDLPLPVVVVQHMPAGFTVEFAKSLNKVCPLEVKEAKDGDRIQKGQILIAPGDYHMEVEKRGGAGVVRVFSGDPVNGHRPSVDVLFHSVAKQYSDRAMAIIMTGMGKDGVKGIGAIKSLGGVTLGQDKESCVVFGMPKVAIESGFIQYIVPLDDMAETVSRLIKGERQPA
jgi:two-component system chemotaxis response regulator CheB